MEFCPKCGKMLGLKDGSDDVLVCASCGFEKTGADAYIKVEGKTESPKVVVNDENPNLPTSTETCEKCGNEKAYFWVEQTRAADEPPTRFYKCTKCGEVWRGYG